jgi:hypothetical protein
MGIKVNYTSYQGNGIFTAILAPKYPATYFILQEDPTVWQETQFDIARRPRGIPSTPATPR